MTASFLSPMFITSNLSLSQTGRVNSPAVEIKMLTFLLLSTSYVHDSSSFMSLPK